VKGRSIGLLGLFLLAFIFGLEAQTVPPASQTYTWTAAPTGNAGQLGNYLILNGTNFSRPSNYTIDATVTGTTPAACTFRVEGSSDGTTWYGLDVTAPSTTSCTTSYMESIANRPVLYLRVFLTYTQGDTTTKVVFHWTGAGSK